MATRNRSLSSNFIHTLRIDWPSDVVEVAIVLVVRRDLLLKVSKSTTLIPARF